MSEGPPDSEPARTARELKKDARTQRATKGRQDRSTERNRHRPLPWLGRNTHRADAAAGDEVEANLERLGIVAGPLQPQKNQQTKGRPMTDAAPEQDKPDSASPATADEDTTGADGATPEQVRAETERAGADVADKPENQKPVD